MYRLLILFSVLNFFNSHHQPIGRGSDGHLIQERPSSGNPEKPKDQNKDHQRYQFLVMLMMLLGGKISL